MSGARPYTKPDSSGRPILELRGISKIYRMGEIEGHALRKVDFTVRAGELVAIMGASGSGKSTMLNLIGTLDRPSEGEYFLDGEPVQDLDEYELASRQVMDLFVALHRQGMTVVLVTHDPNIAAYAERVVSFQDGVIVSDETRTRDSNAQLASLHAAAALGHR
jgi:ABC-type lipoprotein export system ATPase subunit